MAFTERSFGRWQTAAFDLDVNDINSYIDIELDALNGIGTVVDASAKTGFPNDTTAITFEITVGGGALPVSVNGEDAQTIGELVAAIEADVSASASCFLVEHDNTQIPTRIRILADAAGATTISITDVGNLLQYLRGNKQIQLNASYMSAVVGAGIVHRIAPGASAETPVQTMALVQCSSESGGVYTPIDPTTVPYEYKPETGEIIVAAATLAVADRIVIHSAFHT